ncbi:Mu transposase C-terminal domain-containing protein [Microvirga aerilata]|uniref:Mu transposase C-terminal domain-containing protein n=1 Tax=Microvirga aerilata TaxID=670292 RepID=UPI00363FF3E9
MTLPTAPQSPKMPRTVPTPFVPRYRLEPHARYIIDGTLEFVAHSSDDHGHVLRRVDNPNLCESFTHAVFAELLDEGRMNIVRDYHRASAAAVRLEGPERLITELAPKRRERLLARKDVCDAFLRAEAAGETSRADVPMKAFIKRYAMGILEKAVEQGRCGSDDIIVKRPPSPTALRKWLRKYEACGFDAMSLRDGYGRSGNRMPRLESEERALMREIAERYASRLQPTKATLYIDLVDAVRKENLKRRATGERLLKKPSRAAFERVISGLDPFMVCAGREERRRRARSSSSSAAASTCPGRSSGWRWMPGQFPPGHSRGCRRLVQALPEIRAEVGRRRLLLSVAIDCYTRCILAARIIDSNTSTAAVSTIAMAVMDKSRFAEAAGCVTPWDQCGTGETYATDNDKAYTAYETRASVTDMGSEMLFPPAGTPQNRARIERFFRTIHKQLVALFHGRSFENVVAKGDYESEANAVIDADELGRAIVRWIVDVYHNTPHEGLGGETPRNCWIRTTRLHPVLPPPDPDVCRHIFGITVERRITNSGVRVLGLNYQSEEIQRLRRVAQQKPVLVRIDEGDLGYVSVRAEDGWLTVPCVKAGFNGVPLERWVATERALRREHADMARLSEEVVLQALADIKAFSASATQRAGIASPIITSTDVDRLERDRFRTFSFDRGPEDGPAVFDPVDVAMEDDADTPCRTDAAQMPGPDGRGSGAPEGDDGTKEDDYGMED